MYSLIYLEAARKVLGKLDRSVALRIKRKLDWLLENIENIEPDWLRSDLSGWAKLREGDFRIVYEIRSDTNEILVHSIGHRSEIYKR